MSRSAILRLTFSLALLPTGALLVLLAGGGPVGILLENLGLSIMVAGVLGSFRELALLKLESDETGQKVADLVYKKVISTLPSSGGLKLVAPIRRGYAGYYFWAVTTEAQDLFFAGRSVLHRIDADFTRRGLGRADEVIHRKLCEGSNVRILFLDPRSTLLPRLATEEGQTLELLLADITRSLAVCRRLAKLINDQPPTHRAHLDVRVYDEVPYFAYHKVDNDVTVGFYFTTALGSQSSAFEIEDPNTQEMFSGHFTSIFVRAADNIICDVSDRNPQTVFNETLFHTLHQYLDTKLGAAEVNKLLNS
jgi:hypothetical protein